MAKVLLVEDDNNLREIYEARLQAEGYETVTASDGEQALVVAKDAKPDLVISDVMMPKISGFEMLDILRNTDGLKDVKVIMLTALGQSEDKTRADQLGADKYLVKSQVTLEDIVKTAHQLLDDAAPAATQAATPAAEPAAPVAVPDPVAVPAAPAADPVAAVSVDASSASDESAAMQAQIDNFAAAPAEPVATPEPTAAPASPVAAEPITVPAPTTDAVDTTEHDEVMAEAVDSLADASPDAEKPSEVTAVEVPPAPADAATASAPAAVDEPTPEEAPVDGVTIAHKKIVQPISDPATAKPDLNVLLAAEEAKVTGATVAPSAVVVEAPDTTAADSAAMQAQLDGASATTEAPAAPTEPSTQSAPAAPTQPIAPPAITEPPVDPNAPNPNDIAL